MGIGYKLKSDDYIGPQIISELEKELKNNKIKLINAENVPENFTGKIKKENPTHIIIIDAALMQKPPGYIRVIKKEEIKHMGFSTHSMSLDFLINYLEKENKSKTILIGIQPESLNLDIGLSENLEKSKEELKKILLKI